MQSPASLLKANIPYAAAPAIVLVFGLAMTSYLSWRDLDLAAGYVLANAMCHLFLQPLNGAQIAATRCYQQGVSLGAMAIAMLPLAAVLTAFFLVAMFFLQDWLGWSDLLKQHFWALLAFIVPVNLVGQTITAVATAGVMAEKRANFMFRNSLINNLILLGGLIVLELFGVATITALAIVYFASMVFQTSAYLWITRDLKWRGTGLSNYWQFWRQVVSMSSDVLIVALVMNVLMVISTDMGPVYAVLTSIIMQSNRLMLIPMKRLGVLFGTELNGKFNRQFTLQATRLTLFWVFTASIPILGLIYWRSEEMVLWLLLVIAIQYACEPITSMLATMLKYTGNAEKLLAFYTVSLLLFALPMLFVCQYFWPDTYWALWAVLVAARLVLAGMVLWLFQQESAKQGLANAR